MPFTIYNVGRNVSEECDSYFKIRKINNDLIVFVGWVVVKNNEIEVNRSISSAHPRRNFFYPGLWLASLCIISSSTQWNGSSKKSNYNKKNNNFFQTYEKKTNEQNWTCCWDLNEIVRVFREFTNEVKSRIKLIYQRRKLSLVGERVVAEWLNDRLRILGCDI